MSIKTRFMILYTVMIVAPFFLIIWTTPFISNLAVGNFSPLKLPVNFFNVSVGMSIQPSVDEQELTALIFNKKPLRNFEVLRNPLFLEHLEKKLNVGLLKTGFIVQENDFISYHSPFLRAIAQKMRLSGVKKEIDVKSGDFHIFGAPNYHYSRFDFRFNHGAPGSLFIVYDYALLKQAVLNVLIGILVTVILVFIVINVVITFFISRSIIKPLHLLEEAAGRIKEGDLDFHIPTIGKGEIGELTSAFEAMRHKLHESLQKQMQYEANRKELISGISHDLRTPIAAVKGYIEGIRDGVANSPEKEARYIEIIHRKATEVEELINKLFLYSKLDLKQMPYNFERIPIAAFLRDYLDDLRFDLAAKKVEIVFQTDVGVETTVVADRKELIRVINNLVDNSVKFMNERDVSTKKIIVSLKEDEGNVVVEVRDDGPGIAESDLPFIFERFYQARSPESRSGDGSGLGLAISKIIVEGHGGKIWAESRLGVGTCIFFTLKRDPPHQER